MFGPIGWGCGVTKQQLCVELSVRVPEVEMPWLIELVQLRGREWIALNLAQVAGVVRKAWRKAKRRGLAGLASEEEQARLQAWDVGQIKG